MPLINKLIYLSNFILHFIMLYICKSTNIYPKRNKKKIAHHFFIILAHDSGMIHKIISKNNNTKLQLIKKK